MRMSRGITLTLLSGLVLTTCLTTRGCGRHADTRWHDAQGHVVPERWTTTADGKRVPDPHPYDAHGHPWVYDANGNLVPPATAYSSSHRSGGWIWLWGGSGYRSTGTTTSYRSGPSVSSPSRSSSTSSPSISRGGFGSTGMSSAG